MSQSPHLGRKISRIRELRGMKQETLAEQLGISQQAVSKIEQSESVDDTMLERISKALGVTPGIIRTFNEEAAIFAIQNNYEGSSKPELNINSHCTFNPLDKMVEAFEENKRLYEELLRVEREKMALLERIIGSR
jgi:transcriptional regulator with XRE-family HTH domain